MSISATRAGLVLGILISILSAGVRQPSSAGELTLAKNSRTDHSVVIYREHVSVISS